MHREQTIPANVVCLHPSQFGTCNEKTFFGSPTLLGGQYAFAATNIAESLP